MTNKTKLLATGSTIAILVGFMTSGCYYDSKEELGLLNPPCDTVAVSYSADIVPILESECMVCHSTASAPIVGGGNDLEGYSNISNFVEPGIAAESVLYKSVAWIAPASFMPKSGAQLPACELALIRSWIDQGALDN